jgi:hypothetical protein
MLQYTDQITSQLLGIGSVDLGNSPGCECAMCEYAPPQIDGIDKPAQAIIDVRWPIWCSHIQHWLESSEQWHCDLLHPENIPLLQQPLQKLQQSMTETAYARDDPRGYAARTQALRKWEHNYLLPLARDLRVYERVTQVQIAACLHHGWFDQRTTKKNSLQRPQLVDIVKGLDSILAIDFERDRISALQIDWMCRDSYCAAHVVKELSQIDSLSASSAWAVTLAVISYGPLGLLTYTTHPCADELILLQRHADTISHLSDTPDLVLAALRADIIALCSTLRSLDELTHQPLEDSNRTAQPSEKCPKLWRPDFLHQTAHSQARQQYRQRLTPEIQRLIVERLTLYRDCSQAQAEELFDTWANKGLNGLVAYHIARPHESTHTFMMARIRSALDRHLGWLKAYQRQEVERLLLVLQEVIDMLKLPVSLFPLVDEFPGSTYRSKIKILLRSDKRLVTVFAQLAELTDDDASARLFAFVSYGGFGLLRFLKQDELYGLLDRQLVEFIHFHKLAHPENSLLISQLEHVVNIYVAMRGYQPLSPQVTRALYNRLPKPRRWHGGQGDETAILHQRAVLSPRYTPQHHREPSATSFAEIPQLHRSWILVPVQLPINLVDEAGRLQSHTGHVLAVLDYDSTLPIGNWVSPWKPRVSEIGLAVYQAIWHVGRVNWPLRGVPQSIKVPHSLTSHPDDLADLHRAAAFLLTTVETYRDERIWQHKRIITELRNAGPDIIPLFPSRTSLTCQQAQDGVLTWLHNARFSSHNPAEMPATFWETGYAMPAYNSPAAGWLLPQANDHVRSLRNAVVRGDMVYTTRGFMIEPGETHSYRIFPYTYPGTERGIFIEYGTGLHYLHPDNSRL